MVKKMNAGTRFKVGWKGIRETESIKGRGPKWSEDNDGQGISYRKGKG